MAQVTKEQAVEMFAALGINTAAKWNAKRMAAKLAKVNEMVDEDTVVSGPAADTLTTVLTAIENEEEITLAKGEAPAPATEEPKTEEPKAKAKKGKAKTTKPKAKKEAKEPTPHTPGVRETKTRAYLAGEIVGRCGLEAGVTDEMIAELNKAFGKANDIESRARLRGAWHSIRGYLATVK